MTFRDEVILLEQRFLDAFARGDVAACADVYTDDAVYLVPGLEPIRGRSAIEAATVRELAGGLKITLLTAFHTEASGDLGYARLRPTPAAPAMAPRCSLTVAMPAALGASVP